MRVLVAPDKFAGTLSAVEAAEAIAAGWRDVAPDAAITTVPLSDGGPGFVDVLAAVLGGSVRLSTVRGPSGEPTPATWLLAGGVAYVEAAQACGLALVPEGERRPLDASTQGVGDLLGEVLAAGVGRVVVGVGGTASTDGGAGMVEAFGRPWPSDVELVVATDVESPLLGAYGAARTFGPQKGATDADVEVLEMRLAAWARATGGDPNAAGAGAGGGLGYGLMLLGATRASGSRLVLDAVGLDEQVGAHDLVVTGEGSFDFSSLRGKLVSAVAALAQRQVRPCVVLAGRVEVGRREAAAIGVEDAYDLVGEAGSLEAALAEPARWLAATAGRAARGWGR